jgi:hypothetical protein
MANWDYNHKNGSGVIYFDDGKEVFLQNEEASELDNRIEGCTEDYQIQDILCEYHHIAEEI